MRCYEKLRSFRGSEEGRRESHIVAPVLITGICAPTHILNTPNLVSGIGALSAAEKHSASTRRVSPGVMMPSSHSRAVA